MDTEVGLIREGEEALALAGQLLNQRRLPEAVDPLSPWLEDHPNDDRAKPMSHSDPNPGPRQPPTRGVREATSMVMFARSLMPDACRSMPLRRRRGTRACAMSVACAVAGISVLCGTTLGQPGSYEFGWSVPGEDEVRAYRDRPVWEMPTHVGNLRPLDEEVEADGDDPGWRYVRGCLLQEMRRYDDALRDFEVAGPGPNPAVRGATGVPDAYFAQLMALGRARDSLGLLAGWREERPDDARNSGMVAAAYYLLGDHHNAQAWLPSAWAVDGPVGLREARLSMHAALGRSLAPGMPHLPTSNDPYWPYTPDWLPALLDTEESVAGDWRRFVSDSSVVIAGPGVPDPVVTQVTEALAAASESAATELAYDRGDPLVTFVSVDSTALCRLAREFTVEADAPRVFYRWGYNRGFLLVDPTDTPPEVIHQRCRWMSAMRAAERRSVRWCPRWLATGTATHVAPPQHPNGPCFVAAHGTRGPSLRWMEWALTVQDPSNPNYVMAEHLAASAASFIADSYGATKLWELVETTSAYSTWEGALEACLQTKLAGLEAKWHAWLRQRYGGDSLPPGVVEACVTEPSPACAERLGAQGFVKECADQVLDSSTADAGALAAASLAVARVVGSNEAWDGLKPHIGRLGDTPFVLTGVQLALGAGDQASADLLLDRLREMDLLVLDNLASFVWGLHLCGLDQDVIDTLDDHADAVSSDSSLLVLKAIASMSMSEFEDALADLKAAAALTPHSASVFRNLFAAAKALGLPDGALTYAEKTARLAPWDFTAAVHYGAQLEQCGEVAAAIGQAVHAQEIAQRGLRPEMRLGPDGPARRPIRTGETEIDSRAPSRVEMEYLASSLLVHVYAGAGKLSNAEFYASRAQDRFPEEAEPCLWAAKAQAAQGNMVGAIHNLESAVRLDPSFAAAHELLVELHVANGDLDAARRALRRGIKDCPDSTALATRADELLR